MNSSPIHLHPAYREVWSNLENLILNQVPKVEAWFREMWRTIPAPLTSSVDLRNAGYKLAPVDTNLFPAGFNNLNPDSMSMCVQAFQSVLTPFHPPCKRILLVPEAHTRNRYYLENLNVLKSILIQAGFEVLMGHWAPLEPEEGGLQVERIERVGTKLVVNGVTPCIVILNNDLSNGIPSLFEGIEQPIFPSPQLGWSIRKKSRHFKLYGEVVNAFAALLNCDPWFFYPEMAAVEEVNFMDKTGLTAVAEAVDAMLERVKKQYVKYDIKEQPFAVIKADQGTYGMSVMMVPDGESVLNLNRKQRTKMAVSKGNREVHQVLIQEGVYTFESMSHGAAAEPVVYMIGPYVVGGFYRVHKGRGAKDNLNAPGMHFEPLAFTEPCNTPCCELTHTGMVNRFYVYGVIARLAALAAGKETLDLESKR